MAGGSRWRSGRGRLALAAALAVLTGAGVAVALAVTGSTRSNASGVPTVGFGLARMTRVEGASGSSVLQVPVTLSAASATPVSVRVVSTDGTATAVGGLDYVAVDRTVQFAPGERNLTVPVTINGDTSLEDYELLRLALRSPSGAVLGRTTVTIVILNDERPQATMADLRVTKGTAASFRPRLVQRYYRPLTATFRTADGTAQAGVDYTATDTTVTFAAGSRTTPAVAVPTSTGTPAGTRTFSATASGADLAASTTATATIVEPSCAVASGSSPQPAAAPTSPSSPRTSAPPAAVTAGTPWDIVFQDDFADASATAARWSTGMRDGSKTLAGNKELQWYSPANSTVTTAPDGGATISVLQQRLTSAPVAGEFYPVGTLSRLYPVAKCPQLYDATRLAPDDPSLVPYQFRSGMLNSAKSFAFRYGYVEARVRMPKGFALWPALWLRDWQPWSYEIDALEGFDRDARLVRSTYWWGDGSRHGTDTTGGDLGIAANGAPCRGRTPLAASTTDPATCSLATAQDLSAGYHTIGLNWTATRYEIYLDGVKRWSSPAGADVASAYNHLIINLAFGNNTYEFNWLKESVRPLDANLLAAGQFVKPTIEWDYVRVWQAPDRHDTCTDGSC